jgi:hypothetical protein
MIIKLEHRRSSPLRWTYDTTQRNSNIHNESANSVNGVDVILGLFYLLLDVDGKRIALISTRYSCSINAPHESVSENGRF